MDNAKLTPLLIKPETILHKHFFVLSRTATLYKLKKETLHSYKWVQVYKPTQLTYHNYTYGFMAGWNGFGINVGINE